VGGTLVSNNFCEWRSFCRGTHRVMGVGYSRSSADSLMAPGYSGAEAGWFKAIVLLFLSLADTRPSHRDG